MSQLRKSSSAASQPSKVNKINHLRDQPSLGHLSLINALKGAGFFLGGFLLSTFGFRGALSIMATGVFVVLLFVLAFLPAAIGQAKKKAPFTGIFSNSQAINRLSVARLALFAARDVWFVVSVPIFLASVLGWSFTQVGGFMAVWVIAYGAVQSASPVLLAKTTRGKAPGPVLASTLGLGLAAVTALIPIGLGAGTPPEATMLGGLMLFGIVFALNSSVHSYLVLAYSEADRVSLSVGFYYMANACGRLLGTLLSGVLYQFAGVSASLWGAVVLAAAAGVGAMFLPPVTTEVDWTGAKGDECTVTRCERTTTGGVAVLR